MKKLVFAVLGVLFFSGLSAQVEIPQMISYQGKLTDATGKPISDYVKMKFTIGSWTQTINNLYVDNGLYSVTLGSPTNQIPVSVFDNSSITVLEIEVENSPLTPTTEILSVPYAFKAEKAVDSEKIAGNTVSTTSPTIDQVLKWNGSQWEPLNDGLTLPYYAIYNGSNYAIDISSQGTGGAASFYIPNNNADVLYVSTDGTGKAARFKSGDSYADNAVDISSESNTSAALDVYNAGSAHAADFDGDVDVNGTFTASDKQFKIDHPLNPENKYLFHSCIESPDMMNVYNGNIVMDNNGEAIVELPEWFEALNKDFRYQLTCIGGFAQVYVSEEIRNNQFKIEGGTAGLKVSWQVTGIRHDPYAEQNRMVVEVEKSDKEKGHYLHYKEYNQPIEKSIKAVRDPEILEKLNK